jgi:hypothetical protein
MLPIDTMVAAYEYSENERTRSKYQLAFNTPTRGSKESSPPALEYPHGQTTPLCEIGDANPKSAQSVRFPAISREGPSRMPVAGFRGRAVKKERRPFEPTLKGAGTTSRGEGRRLPSRSDFNVPPSAQRRCDAAHKANEIHRQVPRNDQVLLDTDEGDGFKNYASCRTGGSPSVAEWIRQQL